MEEQAEKLMIENLSKNMSDADEYVFPSLSKHRKLKLSSG